MKTLSYQYHFEPGTDPAKPPLLLLHGTGGNERDLLPLGRQLSPGSALLSPLGDVLEHGQRRFFRRFTEGVFDLADVERRTQALADFIAEAAHQHGFDASRLTALGFSNGANIAASLLLLRPEALAHAVLLRPMVVLDPPSGPDLHGKKVLLCAGTHDPLVPADHPTRLATLFRNAGAEVSLHTATAGHNLATSDLAAARDFLAGISRTS